MQISTNADAILAASVLTSVKILLVPITALVPWDSNFQLTAGRVKVPLSCALAMRRELELIAVRHFGLILACKTALEWYEKSTQCSLFDYVNSVTINEGH